MPTLIGSAVLRHSAGPARHERRDREATLICYAPGWAGVADQTPEGGPIFVSTSGPKFMDTASDEHAIDSRKQELRRDVVHDTAVGLASEKPFVQAQE